MHVCGPHGGWALTQILNICDQELYNHVTAMTTNHRGHMTRMPTYISWHLEALKGRTQQQGVKSFQRTQITQRGLIL